MKKYEPWQDGFKATQDMVTAKGEKIHVEVVAKVDGKDYPGKGSPDADTYAFKKLDAHTYEVTQRKDGKVTIVAKMVVAPDGKSRSIVQTGKNAKGEPVNSMGQPRPYGAVSDCCKAAPSVLEFDADGKLLQAWGGPPDPGFLGGKCKAEEGCIWPNSEHGIYVDHNDNVWISGSSAAASARSVVGQAPWTTNKDGGDGFVLKFDRHGNFKMRVGGTPKGPNSNDTHGGIHETPLLYQAADMVVDPATNRLDIADGYGNRRVLIVDAGTGKYIGHSAPMETIPSTMQPPRLRVRGWPTTRKGTRGLHSFATPYIASRLPTTARSMSATGETIAFRCSTRTIPPWANRAEIQTATRPNGVS